MITKEKSNAKTIECENPRCPQKFSYGIPSAKLITSASGSIAHSIPRIQNFGVLISFEKTLPIAKAVNACPKIDANSIWFND